MSGTSGSDGETTVIEGMTVNKNPLVSEASFTALSKTYFDDYNWTTWLYTTLYNSYLDAGTNLHVETMPSIASQLTKNRITGTKVRALEDPNNLGAGKWLAASNFYDDKARIIQAQTENYAGGIDVQTTLYDFKDKPLSTYLAHRNPLSTQSTETRIRTDVKYDHSGRVLEIWKTINDDNSKKALIARNQYDALGNLLKKEVGEKRNPNNSYSSATLETLDYTYNIRGWMKGINAGYAHPELPGSSNQSGRLFGMELSYDWGFDQNQVNGNIGGIRWRSGGDGEQRAYGFGYDAANRLLKADFTQDNGGWNTTVGVDFSMKMGDGIDPATAYDANGNIKAMKQWGLKLTGSSVIDEMTYNYKNGEVSNKLLAVTESSALGTSDNKLGDFTDKNRTMDDYDYDANGNLIVDKNKKITATSYNQLNLPYVINLNKDDGTEKGSITYVYDAAGTKLKKVVVL